MVVDNVREFLENGNVTRCRQLPRDGAAAHAPASRRDSAQERAEHGRADSDGARRAEHQHRRHAESFARRALLHARRSRRAADRGDARPYSQHRRHPVGARAADHRRLNAAGAAMKRRAPKTKAKSKPQQKAAPQAEQAAVGHDAHRVRCAARSTASTSRFSA